MRVLVKAIVPLLMTSVHTITVLQPAFGQTNTFPASGNVGIGTTSPWDKLVVNNGNLTVSRTDGTPPDLSVTSSSAPGWAPAILDLNRYGTGNITPDNSNVGTVRFNGLTTTGGFYTGASITVGGGPNSTNGFPTSIFFLTNNGDGTGQQYRLFVGGNGNVGIGTTTPQSKLAVNGNITATDVMVTNTGWPDYVFQPGYRLRPLREVDAYIQSNHHLPDIPSEAEVKEKGVSVGDMQAKLLAKIEELTLHMIQADDRNNRLEQQNQKLRDRMARLERGAAGVTPAAAK